MITITKNFKKKLIILYLFSRLVIYLSPPPHFSEITYSYMPYAHLWESGETPYLKQWYEYPPATIPLFYAPHLVDKYTWGHLWHLNYAQAYKMMLIAVDLGVFALIWKTLHKLKVRPNVFLLGIIYYILATTKANHYLYDSMDLVFGAAITLGVAAPILWRENTGRFFSWLGYFLAVALKYVNAPLGFLYALLDLKHLSSYVPSPIHRRGDLGVRLCRLVILASLARFLVWGLPLAYFRSSLLVSFEYHKQRGLQIDSMAASLVRFANAFTHSEVAVERYKNYDLVGPLSSQALRVLNLAFPAGIAAFLILGTYLIVKSKKFNFKNSGVLKLDLTLGYVILFMLIGKVLSTPFLLWQIPLLSIYPFRNNREQLKFLIPSSLIILMSMSPWPDIKLLGFMSLPTVFVNLRWILFTFMFISWWQLKRSQEIAIDQSHRNKFE